MDHKEELQEIFERHGCPGRGRRFDPSILQPEHGLRTMLQRHKRDSEKWLEDVRVHHAPSMGPVHFEYIENLEMNALAFESENHEFVGVYVGAVATIYSFFGFLLANPTLLTSIGNPLLEEGWRTDSFDPKRLFTPPRDPARRSFAHLISTIAIDFLFHHELGHLMNGHVRLLQKSKGISLMAEVGEALKTPEDYITRQTLEMDADSFAVGQGFATAFGRLGEPDKVFPLDWRQWYATPKQVLFSWMLAIYGLFRLFFEDLPDLDKLDCSNHPPPNIRLNMAMATFIECMRAKRLDELIPEFGNSLEQVLATVETGIAIGTSKQADLSGVQQALDPRALQHIERLLNHWKILRPQLIPLNRGGRLAG